jgi:hypothetical protein
VRHGLQNVRGAFALSDQRTTPTAIGAVANSGRPMNKLLIASALTVVAVAGCNTSGTKGSGTSNDTFQHAEDVKITSCVKDPTSGFADAKVTVTNNSSKPSNYVITIAFDNADGSQLATSPVFVSNLDPGQSSVQDANAITDATPGYTCKIADATRNAA